MCLVLSLAETALWWYWQSHIHVLVAPNMKPYGAMRSWISNAGVPVPDQEAGLLLKRVVVASCLFKCATTQTLLAQLRDASRCSQENVGIIEIKYQSNVKVCGIPKTCRLHTAKRSVTVQCGAPRINVD